MLGALVGDIVGSCYEGRKCIIDEAGYIVGIVHSNGRHEKVSRRAIISQDSHITDDSVLTLATAAALSDTRDFARKYIDYFVMTSKKNAFYQGDGIGYGAKFLEWADRSDREGVILPPYHSYGNGAAMRVSPVAYVAKTPIEVLNLSLESCLCTHNTPSAIKSAQAVAISIWLARAGFTKEDILSFVESSFDYSLRFNDDELVSSYSFNPTADGSVPVALYLALTSDSFEQVMVRCLRVGGDTDTIASIAGSVAEPLFGIPTDLAQAARQVVEKDSAFLWDKYALFAERHAGTVPSAEVASRWKKFMKRFF